MSSYNSNSASSFDNLMLQSLMGRLQLRPPYLHTNSFLSQSLSDFLADRPISPSDDEDDDDDSDKTILAKEESKLEKAIVRLILAGDTESLKPNSGQAVTVGDHHICVGFHEEKGSDYRVWEWHGHIMLFDEENGYTPEYIYGNYFEKRAPVAAGSREKVSRKEEEEEGPTESGGGNLGLRELIGGAGEVNGRVLRRNLNVGSRSYNDLHSANFQTTAPIIESSCCHKNDVLEMSFYQQGMLDVNIQLSSDLEVLQQELGNYSCKS